MELELYEVIENLEYLVSDSCTDTQFDYIEEIEIATKALEKQMPMKPYHISQVDDNDNANVECPMCHATTDYAVNVIKRGYCWKCGQLLYWR